MMLNFLDENNKYKTTRNKELQILCFRRQGKIVENLFGLLRDLLS